MPTSMNRKVFRVENSPLGLTKLRGIRIKDKLFHENYPRVIQDVSKIGQQCVK